MKKLFFALAAMAIVAVSCQKEDIYSNPFLDETNLLIESQKGNIDDEALCADLKTAILDIEEMIRLEYDEDYLLPTGAAGLEGIKFTDDLMWSYWVPRIDVAYNWGCKTKYEYNTETRVFTYPEFEGKSAKVVYYDGSKIIIDGKIGIHAREDDDFRKPYRYVIRIYKEMPDGWAPFPTE